jgi:hypothetical protein
VNAQPPLSAQEKDKLTSKLATASGPGKEEYSPARAQLTVFINDGDGFKKSVKISAATAAEWTRCAQALQPASDALLRIEVRPRRRFRALSRMLCLVNR